MDTAESASVESASPKTPMQARTVVVEYRADLDVPGETARQIEVFMAWAACLLLAVVVSQTRRPGRDDFAGRESYQKERVVVAVGAGLALPMLLTWWLTHRRRRGGSHARGIRVDVTDTDELRIWGRGYGDRIQLEGAEVTESLVDVYTGRLGSWSQRRIRIKARRASEAGRYGELQLACVASEPSDSGLRRQGGEGDCVELRRDDYLALVERVRRLAGSLNDESSNDES